MKRWERIWTWCLVAMNLSAIAATLFFGWDRLTIAERLMPWLGFAAGAFCAALRFKG